MTNTKALKFINNPTNLNAIYSYLEADLLSSFQNSIKTIPMSERSQLNGYSNFFLTYKERITGNIEQVYLRLETNVFLNKICLNPTLLTKLTNANLIIFADTTDNRIFVSDAKLNNNHNWLQNKSLRNIENYVTGSGRSKSCYVFNLETLLETHAIFEIIPDTKNIYIAHDSFCNYFKQMVIQTPSDRKNLIDYNIDVSHIKNIQFDKKERDTVFYCFHNEKQTNKSATLLGIAEEFSNYSSLSVDSIYQRLRRAAKKDGFAVIPCDGKIDKRFLNEKGFIEIALSFVEDTFVQQVKLDRKVKDKIKKYKKTHTEAKESWTNEEKAFFYTI